MTEIQKNITSFHKLINLTEEKYGRELGSVKLLAVSKMRTTDEIRQAYRAGQTLFAENYVQEAITKMKELMDLNLEWHFIGTVQANKARKIAEHFSWVHSVSNKKIAQRLNDHRPHQHPPLNVCLEINLEKESTKTGAIFDEVIPLAKAINLMPHLKLRGLMAIPKPCLNFAEQRKIFSELRECFDKLNQQDFHLDTLSMGMSQDYVAAIAEGATIIRIGTAIFGKRGISPKL